MAALAAAPSQPVEALVVQCAADTTAPPLRQHVEAVEPLAAAARHTAGRTVLLGEQHGHGLVGEGFFPAPGDLVDRVRVDLGREDMREGRERRVPLDLCKRRRLTGLCLSDHRPWRSMNSSVRFQASSEAPVNSSCLRSKKLCGAPSYTTSSWSTSASLSACSNASLSSAVMCWSAPACSPRIGASIFETTCSGPGEPSAAAPGRP